MLFIVVCAFTAGCGSQNATGKPDPTVLPTPVNVRYDEKAHAFTWDAVKNADKYTISITEEVDGEPRSFDYNVKTNEYCYTPTFGTTTFKVQASASYYKPSEWSETATYTVTKGLNGPAIYAYVNEVIGGLRVLKIVSIESFISSREENVVYISAVFSDGHLYNYEYQYEHPIQSLKSVIENNDYERTRLRLTYDYKDFDTAGSFLKRSEYVGTLEEYRRNGYTITAISSQAYEINNSKIGLDGVYKATKGDETKYFYIKLEFGLDATAIESARYTYGVENIDLSKVREVYCYELTGDFIDALSLYVDNSAE